MNKDHKLLQLWNLNAFPAMQVGHHVPHLILKHRPAKVKGVTGMKLSSSVEQEFDHVVTLRLSCT